MMHRGAEGLQGAPVGKHCPRALFLRHTQGRGVLLRHTQVRAQFYDIPESHNHIDNCGKEIDNDNEITLF